MDRARFEAILAAYGADPKRWPQDERAAAEAFAAEAPEIVQDARTTDALLDLDRDAAPASLPLIRALIAAAPKPVVSWRAAAALAACAVLGLAAGYSSGRLAPDPGAAEAVLSAAFGEGLDG